MALSRPAAMVPKDSVEAYMEQNVSHLSAAHYKVAKTLELCYLRGFSFPKFSEEICGHATNARVLQELCAGLMKKFGTNAHVIATEGIPTIIELLEIGEKEIVIGYFDEVITQAKEMSKEADKTTQECIKLSVDVGTSRGNVKKEQASRQKDLDTVIEKKRTDVISQETTANETERLSDLVEFFFKKIESLEKDKKDLKTDMEKIKNDAWDRLKTYGALTLGVVFLVDMIRYSGKAVTFHFKSSAVSELDLKQKEHVNEKEKAENKLSDLTKKIELLSSKSENLRNECDILLGAFPLLTKVQDYLTQLRSFWDATAALLMGFKQRAETNRFFYDKAKHSQTAKLIKRNLAKLEKSFSNFGVICDGYVHGCEYDSKLAVEDLFAFLDGRVEKWNKGILSAKILSVETELKEL